jgi:hypothetical protein
MEETKDYERRFPPRSKFNDEEATAVLRLIIEQEKLLKNASASPLLNITANRLQRLPPLNAKRSESLDENELENVRTRKSSGNRDSGSEMFLNKPTLLKGKDSRSLSDNGTLPGKPRRVPDIYSTPKIAKHRERERPKGSYGRNNVLRKERNNELAPLENHSIEQQKETEIERPSNPLIGEVTVNQENNTFSSNSIDTGYISDQEFQRPTCPAPTRCSPPSYIN